MDNKEWSAESAPIVVSSDQDATFGIDKEWVKRLLMEFHNSDWFNMYPDCDLDDFLEVSEVWNGR